MLIIVKIVAAILLIGLAGAYFQLGLYLTTYGTPFPIMHGLVQWLAWMNTPIVIAAVLVHELVE